MLLSNAVSDITFGDSALYAVLGYAVVFFGLILLQLVMVLIGKYFIAAAKRREAAAEAARPAPCDEPAPAPAEAPGTAGQLKLHNVDPKTAAMLMAIVADKLGKPLNELRFISIKEVSQ